MLAQRLVIEEVSMETYLAWGGESGGRTDTDIITPPPSCDETLV